MLVNERAEGQYRSLGYDFYDLKSRFRKAWEAWGPAAIIASAFFLGDALVATYEQDKATGKVEEVFHRH